jgi:hypothetical protein
LEGKVMISESSRFLGVPQPIVDLACNLVDFVERSVGIRPDFSMDTLSIVDHYATIARAEVEKRPELADLTAQALGAYFGEVARRNLGAFWIVPGPNFNDWSLCGETAYVSINPIGVGYDALFDSNTHGGPTSPLKVSAEDRVEVARRLDQLPPVRDSEFFTLCTRLEVLEIAMDCIRGQSDSRGYTEVTYSAEDYGSGLRPLSDV